MPPVHSLTPLPDRDELDELLQLATRGIVRTDLHDHRWDALIVGVTRRGVVTAADRRAAETLLEVIAHERAAAPIAEAS
ncbi:hypothetical protein [Homoserinibacter sp. GY 40078]|uniref:hypothetical protein n=1 Tax=Homoserinibacter sp. GY 40078 TaxID=2603275 RepID=UPI0011CBDE1A|nr:hypothetical protein [Homoserinibacter sp. GY 40078]TXK18838.1 hypothetical protein FVQ89_02535 [Homoserinibacter sp. GY 40078]